ncbi:MAG TPA: cytochrome c1, partial [Hyphomicrobiaceae bacterium]|nr:cytochrome c1 [Hyphomicrobiaceae bacterium]
GGVDYIYAFLTGFKEPPAGIKVPDGMNFNTAFPAPHFTGMPDPFAGGDGFIKYDDGTPETVDNYARDVASFLAWSANPELNQRKRLGVLVMLYLLITTILLYFAKKRIWSKMH